MQDHTEFISIQLQVMLFLQPAFWAPWHRKLVCTCTEQSLDYLKAWSSPHTNLSVIVNLMWVCFCTINQSFPLLSLFDSALVYLRKWQVNLDLNRICSSLINIFSDALSCVQQGKEKTDQACQGSSSTLDCPLDTTEKMVERWMLAKLHHVQHL